MPLLSVVFTLVVIGFLLWLANRFMPMDAKIKGILNIVVVVAVVVWVLNAFGVFGHLGTMRLGN